MSSLELEKVDFQATVERMQERAQKAQVKLIGKTNQNISSSVSREELEKCGIFKRYRHCTFETMEKHGIPEQIQTEYKQVKNYAANIEKHIQKGIGMILKGPVGTMKTSLAIAILQKHIKSSGSGLFIPMSSLLDNLFTLKERNKEEWIRYEERIRKTGILVLDDLGSEYHQEWVMSKVDAIVNERYNRMKPIIITSNLLEGQIKDVYRDRITDRLWSTSIIVTFKGKSLRNSAIAK